MRFLESGFWKKQKRGEYLLLAAAIVIGCGLAYHRRWLCDDAFISFRYAQNLLRYGELVFNPGERVEGYTNFLWTLLLAGGQRLGLPPEQSAILLGLISYALLMFFFWALAPSLAGGARPLSLLALALHAQMTIFATSGLETMFFTMLAVTGTLWLCDPRRPVWPAFLLFSLSILVRPDGAVFFAGGGLAVGLRSWRAQSESLAKRFARTMVSLLRSPLAFGILATLYWLWRWQYFDAFFPNTFYAKSAHSAYLTQGLVYIGLYLLSYWMIPAAAVVLLLLRIRKANDERPAPTDSDLVPIWAALSLWTIYVLWIGGDFMFGRHLVPITALCVLLLEAGLRRQIARLSGERAHWIAASALFVFSLSFLLRIDLYADPTRAIRIANQTGVIEESLVYPRRRMEAAIAGLQPMRAPIAESGATLAFWGAGAFLVYYLDPRRAIEASTGLTERELARRDLSDRGRIGHEKMADIEYLRRRGVHISLNPPPPERYREFNRIELPGLPGHQEIVRFEPEVMARLKRESGVRFTDFRDYFDRYKLSPPNAARRREDAKFFRRYYFDHVNDQRREAELNRLLVISR